MNNNTILGIIGGTNTGKTFIRNLIEMHYNILGFASAPKVFDADKALANLYAHNHEVINNIKDICPEAIINNQVYTRYLAPFYFASDENAKAIEDVSRHEIKQAASAFIIECRAQHHFAILDMPMLIKLDLHKQCDQILMVIADYKTRKNRAIERMARNKNYSAEIAENTFDNIVKKQSGLSLQKQQAISAMQAADIADQNYYDILKQSNIPFFTLDNSSNQTPEALLSLIELI